MSQVNIFISHSSKDHDFVWELAKRMKKDLKDVAKIFIDDWEIKVGDSIVGKINEAVQNADFFIVILSKHSIKQEWVKREIDIAFAKLTQNKTRILPVWLEISEEEIPPILLPLKAAVFKTRIIDEKEYQKLIEPILNHKKAKDLLEIQERILDNIQHLDLILQKEKPTRQEVEFALHLIKESSIYERYFFSKLHSFKWFNILKLEGFFSPEKAPGPKLADEEGFYRIPYWNVLDYLERVSQKAKEPGNEIYIQELLEIIKEVTEYHKKTGRSDNYRTWCSFIRIISNLPNERIPMEIIELIPTWLDSKFDTMFQTAEITRKLLPKFLTNEPEDIKKAEKIIEYITEVGEKDGEKLLKANAYLLKNFFKEHLNAISERYSTEVIDILAKRIEELASSEYDGTLFSLYDYEKIAYLSERPVELFAEALSKILLIKSEKDPQQVGEALESFFEKSHPIFTKIALFVIGQNINMFKNLFWEVLKNKGNKIFEGKGVTIHWGDELKKVLENLGPLDEKQRSLLKKKIEIAADKYAETLEDKNEKEKERRKAIFKQKIYKALSYDKEFKALYDEMKRITGVDVELHPVIEKTESESSWEESPLSVGEILEKDNVALAEYLRNFETVDPWKGPTVEGLAETLRTVVKTNPEKFTENLEPFLNVDYLYVAKLLEGLKEALVEDGPVDYKKILDFIEKYIDREEFWQDKLKTQSSMPATHKWVISAFCYFINEGFKNRAFPIFEELLGKIERVIHLILGKLEIEKIEQEIYDPVSHSLNSAMGQILETYIKFIRVVLQSSLDESKKETMRKNFIEKFKEFLERQVIEAYTFLGMYLQDFYFNIDREFTREIIKTMSKKKKTWEAFMEGHLTNGHFHEEIYRLMRDHYKAGLDYSFRDKMSKEMIIDHISLAYLIGLEDLEDPSSLFHDLLEKFNKDDINEIINFFWRQRDYLKDNTTRNKQIIQRILDFWGVIYEKLKEKKESLSEEQKEILSNTVLLTGFLPSPSRSYKEWLTYKEWLKLSVKFIKDAVNFSFLLDYLEEFTEETGNRVRTAKAIGEILLNAPVFTYPRDKIKTLIEYLCETDDEKVKSIARKICDKYAKEVESEDFLEEIKEIYEKCNKKL